MRITEGMRTNRMMLNINRNLAYMNKLNNQLATGKQITYPSDDPILASRALKFRTAVSETQQYQRNVKQGLSWMEATEGAFNNTIEVIKQLREKCEEGASDTKALTDRQALVSNIRQLMAQIASEMNVTYAGKYVYSGYRTDQPVVLQEDRPDSSYTIMQNYKVGDIQKTISYWKNSDTKSIETTDPCYIMKLAYKGMTTVTIPGYTVVTKSYNGTSNPYNVNPNQINYIPETGELVLGSNVAANFATNGTNAPVVMYGTAPNPADYGIDTSTAAGAAYQAHWDTYLDLYNDEYLPRVADYQDKLDQFAKDYAEYEELLKEYNKLIDYATTNGVTPVPDPPVAPEFPEPPVAPEPPNPYNEDLYDAASPGDYDTVYQQYLTNYDTYIGLVSTHQAEYSDYLNDVGVSSPPGVGYKEHIRQFNSHYFDNPPGPTPDSTLPLVSLVSSLPANAPAIPTNTLSPTTRTLSISSQFYSDYDAYMNSYNDIMANMYGSTNFDDDCLQRDRVLQYIAFKAEYGDSAFYVMYDKAGYVEGELNPMTNFFARDTSGSLGGDLYYTTKSNQSYQYEFGVNTRISINSLGNAVYTDKMYADLYQLCELVERIELSTREELEAYYGGTPHSLTGAALEKAVTEHMTLENQKVNAVLQDRFSDMLDLMDKYTGTVSTQHTDLGSRMSRLELIENRLKDDEVNYKALRSLNEDADLVEIATMLSMAEAIYQASLRVAAGILQLSLANYI